MLPVVLVVQGSLFWYFGLYRGVWRFASMPDLVRILKATLTGVAVAAVAIFFLTRLQGVPRSVFVLDAILLVLLLGGSAFCLSLDQGPAPVWPGSKERLDRRCRTGW